MQIKLSCSVESFLGSTRRQNNVRGVSLIEFLVSITIGLLLIATVIAIFSTVFQTRARKAELENALEAYRFAAFTLTDKIRSACAVDATSTSTSIVLQRLEPPPPTPHSRETIQFNSTQRTIEIRNVGPSPAPTPSFQAFVGGIFNVKFEYAEKPYRQRINDGDYEDFTSIALWNEVRSVRITLTMLGEGNIAGVEESFVATLRRKMLEASNCS